MRRRTDEVEIFRNFLPWAYYIMNAAPCGSPPTFIGSIPEKCCRISPDRHYTIKVEGELAVPRSGRRSIRPTANFSRPRDVSHRLPSGIEALGTLFHIDPFDGGGFAGGIVQGEHYTAHDAGAFRIVEAYRQLILHLGHSQFRLHPQHG